MVLLKKAYQWRLGLANKKWDVSFFFFPDD